MALKSTLMALLVAATLITPLKAQAFECSTHLAAAREAIAVAVRHMRNMRTKMSIEDSKLIYDLIGHAKMMYAGARDSHEQSRYTHSHAWAISKAHAALGSAEAADVLHKHLMQMHKSARK